MLVLKTNHIATGICWLFPVASEGVPRGYSESQPQSMPVNMLTSFLVQLKTVDLSQSKSTALLASAGMDLQQPQFHLLKLGFHVL
ncbi:hypothetical protein BDW62DRAFT_174357 [Aspergillus aurantiobrunneus]